MITKPFFSLCRGFSRSPRSSSFRSKLDAVSPAKKASPIATEQNITNFSSHERQAHMSTAYDWWATTDTLLVIVKRQ